jgi:hypothetical protein
MSWGALPTDVVVDVVAEQQYNNPSPLFSAVDIV